MMESGATSRLELVVDERETGFFAKCGESTIHHGLTLRKEQLQLGDIVIQKPDGVILCIV